VYDLDGRMMGEYGSSYTDVRAETIWLSPTVSSPAEPFGGDDGMGGYAPLAVATPAGLNWVYGNHLGVPILITDNLRNVVTPGYTLVGFPGQTRTIVDLYYNRYRDYDPTTGRYIQADPIGLAGGSNLYAYAKNNPLRNIDPKGTLAEPLVVLAEEALPEAIALCTGPQAIVCAAGAAIVVGGGYLLYQYLKSPECIPLTPLAQMGGSTSPSFNQDDNNHDECQLERDAEESYCKRKFSPVANAVRRCLSRAEINYDLCRRRMPGLPWWTDADEDGGYSLPRPPRRK